MTTEERAALESAWRLGADLCFSCLKPIGPPMNGWATVRCDHRPAHAPRCPLIGRRCQTCIRPGQAVGRQRPHVLGPEGSVILCFEHVAP